MLSMKQTKQSKILKTILSTAIILLIAINAGFCYMLIRQYIVIDKILTNEINLISSENFGEKYRNALKNQPVYIELPNAEKIRARVEDYNEPNSVWKLVNKSNSLPIDYTPDSLQLATVKTRTDKSVDERSVRSDIDKALQEMFLDAKYDGFDLSIGSAYRSAQLQSLYFYNLASSVGEETANISIARPGQSEHQTGLAVDISTVARNCYLDNCFAQTEDGEWLANNSYKYGFILRYPKNKTNITGYMYESWHFRYVGTELATALFQSDLTLDEAWTYLEQALIKLKRNKAI